jgi:pimeloyl-ACP methyl ester carboxylesterase
MPEVKRRARENRAVFAALCFLMSVLWVGGACAQVDVEIAAEHGYVRAENDQLFYDLLGQGRTLVLLHDGLLHRVTWDEQFPVLAERFEVVRYDRRGYGRSSRPREPYSDVADLRVLLDSLRVERAALVGCSSGASLAVDFALEYPDRVDALVLVGPVVSGLDYSEHFHTRGGRWVWTEETTPDDVIQYWAVTDPFEIAPHNLELKERVKRLLSVSPQNIEADKLELRQPPGRPAVKFLTEIAVPVLIVVGESDIPDVHAHAGAIEAGVDDAWRVVITGCGHLVHLEAPGIFNELVMDFLKELD